MGKKRHYSSRHNVNPKQVLGDHIKKGSQFLPPLLTSLSEKQLNMADWAKDIIPELLWVDSLLKSFHDSSQISLYYKIIEEIQPHVPSNSGLPGLVSWFQYVPDEIKIQICSKNRDLIDFLIIEPFGDIISIYSSCPMRWLLPANYDSDLSHDPNVVLKGVREAIVRLLDSSNDYTFFCRAIVVGGMIKSGKVHFPNEQLPVISELFDDVNSWPNLLHPERTKPLLRCLFNGFNKLATNGRIQWPKDFWCTNYNITPCKIVENSLKDKADETYSYFSRIRIQLDKIDFTIDNLFSLLHYNTYEPQRDEILTGLIMRQKKYMKLVCGNPAMRSLDTGGVLTRCMVDTHLTFKLICQDKDLIQQENYWKSGLGKDKLLYEQLSKRYVKMPNGDPISEEDLDLLLNSIGEELRPEFLPVEVGAWHGKDMRKLSEELGEKDLYDICYAPGSTAIHGEWNVLKRSNLQRCIEPLHRFHRVPNETLIHVEVFFAVQCVEIFSRSLKKLIEVYAIDYNFNEIENLKNIVSCTYKTEAENF